MALVMSVLSLWRYSGRQVSIILMDHIALDASVSQSLKCRTRSRAWFNSRHKISIFHSFLQSLSDRPPGLLDEDHTTSVSTTDSPALFPGPAITISQAWPQPLLSVAQCSPPRSSSEVPASPPSPGRGSVECEGRGGGWGRGGGGRHHGSHGQRVGGLLVAVARGRHLNCLGQGGFLVWNGENDLFVLRLLPPGAARCYFNSTLIKSPLYLLWPGNW